MFELADRLVGIYKTCDATIETFLKSYEVKVKNYGLLFRSYQRCIDFVHDIERSGPVMVEGKYQSKG